MNNQQAPEKCRICKKVKTCKILDPLKCGEKFVISKKVMKEKAKTNPFKIYSLRG